VPVPEGVEGAELPSIGSAEHAAGTCKRCNFFPKGRCQNGKDRTGERIMWRTAAQR